MENPIENAARVAMADFSSASENPPIGDRPSGLMAMSATVVASAASLFAAALFFV